MTDKYYSQIEDSINYKIHHGGMLTNSEMCATLWDANQNRQVGTNDKVSALKHGETQHADGVYYCAVFDRESNENNDTNKNYKLKKIANINTWVSRETMAQRRRAELGQSKIKDKRDQVSYKRSDQGRPDNYKPYEQASDSISTDNYLSRDRRDFQRDSPRNQYDMDLNAIRRSSDVEKQVKEKHMYELQNAIHTKAIEVSKLEFELKLERNKRHSEVSRLRARIQELENSIHANKGSIIIRVVQEDDNSMTTQVSNKTITIQKNTDDTKKLMGNLVCAITNILYQRVYLNKTNPQKLIVGHSAEANDLIAKASKQISALGDSKNPSENDYDADYDKKSDISSSSSVQSKQGCKFETVSNAKEFVSTWWEKKRSDYPGRDCEMAVKYWLDRGPHSIDGFKVLMLELAKAKWRMNSMM